MQKLVFINGNGSEIDLTSGNFGIVNWAGLSNTSLNIQTQQVPFEDGGVFLDAIMEQREIEVTVAIQDNNNLELRYQKKRELISALNPKLGEGTLIYTNDFLSKQIKAVPQIPLFENKNSNDAGTLKASVAFSCPSPYWEDLEETEKNYSKFNKPVIVNTGDVDIPVNVILNSQGVDNLKIINLTTKKEIEVKNNTHFQIMINTEYGKKSVLGGNVETELQTVSLNLTAKLQEENVLYFGTQSGYLIKTTDYYKTVTWIKKISDYPIIQIYKHDSKYFVCCSEILESQSGNLQYCEMYVTEDFVTFTQYTNLGRKIIYSELFQKYVVVSQGNVIKFYNDDMTLADTVNFLSSPKMIDVCETSEAVYCINSAGNVFRFTDTDTYLQISDSILQLQGDFITACIGDGDYAYFISTTKTSIYKHGTGATFTNGGIRAEKDNYYNGVIINGKALYIDGILQIDSDNLITNPFINYYDEYNYLYTGSMQFSKTRDLNTFEIVKNSGVQLGIDIYCVGVLDNEIIFSKDGNIYKTKDFKLIENISDKGITTNGVGVFKNNTAFITGEALSGFYINIYSNKTWNLYNLGADTGNVLLKPAMISEYLNTLIARSYYGAYISYYDKEQNQLIPISLKTAIGTVKWICEKGKYLYFSSGIYRITCVDMDHLNVPNYKTEIITGINDNNINGGIYIKSHNTFIVWNTTGGVYRSLNVSDWDYFTICNSKINQCIWCEEFNILFVLTDTRGVYLVNIDTLETKHIITTETSETFSDGVYYKDKMYLISNIAIYSISVNFNDNIIDKITDKSDLSLGLQTGENLIGYEGNKDFTLLLKYRQKYIGV